jgi:hypothetical protein
MSITGLFLLAVIIFTALLAPGLVLLVIDQLYYRDRKIRATLENTGATEIRISSIPTFRKYPYQEIIYEVEYKDTQGAKRKAKFYFSQVSSEMKWENLP